MLMLEFLSPPPSLFPDTVAEEATFPCSSPTFLRLLCDSCFQILAHVQFSKVSYKILAGKFDLLQPVVPTCIDLSKIL